MTNKRLSAATLLLAAPLLLVATLLLAAPLVVGVRAARAQSGPPPATGQPGTGTPAPGMAQPGAPGERPDQGCMAWGPRHDWGHGEMDHGGMYRMGRRPMQGWGGGDSMLPLGLWWRNSQVAALLGLTAAQQKQIGDLFLQSRVQLIHLHATLQEEQLMLGPLLNASPFDEAKAMVQIDKIADTRADLEKTNAKMLLNIRGELTEQQWAKLRDHVHGMRTHGDWGGRGD